MQWTTINVSILMWYVHGAHTHTPYASLLQTMSMVDYIVRIWEYMFVYIGNGIEGIQHCSPEVEHTIAIVYSLSLVIDSNFWIKWIPYFFLFVYSKLYSALNWSSNGLTIWPKYFKHIARIYTKQLKERRKMKASSIF